MYRAKLRACNTAIDHASLWTGFKALSSHDGAICVEPCMRTISCHMIKVAAVWYKHNLCAKQVKARIKTDKDTFYANVALDAKEAYERHDLRHFHFCIRRLLPSKHKSYPLRSYKGKIAEEPLESRSFVQQHFSELQSALIVHPRNLVASSQARNSIADYEVMSSDDQYELQKHLVYFFAEVQEARHHLRSAW